MNTIATVTASLQAGSVVVKDVAKGTTKTVKAVERDFNNLGAAVVYYEDGTHWRCGWFNDYHHVVVS